MVGRIINMLLALWQKQEKDERNNIPYGLHGADLSAKSPFALGIVPYSFKSVF